MKEILEGHLLVAAPHLDDEYFHRTVVLILEHDWEGAFGVVLNQPGKDTLEEIWDQQTTNDSDEDGHYVNWGGPVGGPVLALHSCPYFGDWQPIQGIFVTDYRQRLKQLVQQQVFDFRLYRGSAGWSPGQLEQEINRSDWLPLKAKSKHIFSQTDTLWQRMIQQIGRTFVRKTLGIKHIPKETWMN